MTCLISAILENISFCSFVKSILLLIYARRRLVNLFARKMFSVLDVALMLKAELAVDAVATILA